MLLWLAVEWELAGVYNKNAGERHGEMRGKDEGWEVKSLRLLLKAFLLAGHTITDWGNRNILLKNFLDIVSYLKRVSLPMQ